MTTTETDLRPQHFIGGAWVDGAERSTLVVPGPTGDRHLGEISLGTPADVEAAVAAARAAAPEWGTCTPGERASMLLTLADRVAERREHFAAVESANVGKPILYARAEVDEVVDVLRFFAGAMRSGEAIASGSYRQGTHSAVHHEPMGVVGLVTAWNFPLMGAAYKAGAALAAGNTVVLKPSEHTPLTTLLLAELAAQVLPAGALNVVTGLGDPVGTALVTHPDIQMVSLTGAVTTGRLVAEKAAATVKKVHLELGGNCPVVILSDADLDVVVPAVRRAATVNAGQVCLAGARVIVATSLYDEFVERLVAELAQVRVGQPEDGEDVEMGPLAFRAHRDRVVDHLARASHARVISAPARRGPDADAFVMPTVVTDVSQGDAIVQEEVFGPVVTVQATSSDQEAVSFANGTPFGLAASLWTTDLGRAMRTVPQLQFGTVWVNDHLATIPEMPHGGRKQSGYGVEGSAHGIREFQQVKHVWTRYA